MVESTTAQSDAQQLLAMLFNLESQDSATRQAAEQTLTQLNQTKLLQTLLTVLQEASADKDIVDQQMRCVLYLKNKLLKFLLNPAE